MQSNSLFAGEITRQTWWTGVSILVAIWLVWSMASEFLFTGPAGDTIAATLSLVLLAPLCVLCARRLNDLGRPLMPLLAILMVPFALHTFLSRITTLGARETLVETGFSDSQAVVLAPNFLGWLVLAWLLGALAWMVVMLGTRPGATAPSAAEPNPT